MVVFFLLIWYYKYRKIKLAGETMNYKKIISVVLSLLILMSISVNTAVSAQGYGLSCEILFEEVPKYGETLETTNSTQPTTTTDAVTTETVTDPSETTEDTQPGKVPEETVTDPTETTDPSLPDCDSKPVPPSETTNPTDPSEPDCDSKPSITTDPSETTEPEESIPLTGPDGTAPTDPSETTEPEPSHKPTCDTKPSITTDPSETTNPTENTTEPSSTAVTESSEPQQTTAETQETETTESTQSTETTAPTEPSSTQDTKPTSTAPVLNKKELTLASGETFDLQVLNSNGKRVRYSSSDNSVVIISSNGKITALQKGVITITARIDDKKLSCKVTVKNNPRLKQGSNVVKSVTVKKGETVTVNLAGKAQSIDNVYVNRIYAKITSKPSSTKLKVKGLAKGTTTLKIKVNGVKTLKLKVTVK